MQTANSVDQFGYKHENGHDDGQVTAAAAAGRSWQAIQLFYRSRRKFIYDHFSPLGNLSLFFIFYYFISDCECQNEIGNEIEG